jgi:hypothetical protein
MAFAAALHIAVATMMNRGFRKGRVNPNGFVSEPPVASTSGPIHQMLSLRSQLALYYAKSLGVVNDLSHGFANTSLASVDTRRSRVGSDPARKKERRDTPEDSSACS